MRRIAASCRATRSGPSRAISPATAAARSAGFVARMFSYVVVTAATNSPGDFAANNSSKFVPSYVFCVMMLIVPSSALAGAAQTITRAVATATPRWLLAARTSAATVAWSRMFSSHVSEWARERLWPLRNVHVIVKTYLRGKGHWVLLPMQFATCGLPSGSFASSL
jgi:TctA family transporter